MYEPRDLRQTNVSLGMYTLPVIYVVKGHHKFHQPHPCTTGKVFHVLKVSEARAHAHASLAIVCADYMHVAILILIWAQY